MLIIIAALLNSWQNDLLPAMQSIIALVDEWWGVHYAVPGMSEWLHRHPFSDRKSANVSHKFSAEAQQVFLATCEKAGRGRSDASTGLHH